MEIIAQSNGLTSNKKQLFFSAVSGTESKYDSITFTLKKGNAKIRQFISGENPMHFKIISKSPDLISHHQQIKLVLSFVPENKIGIARAIMKITGETGNELASVDLTGLGLKGLEGKNEPPLETVLQALGYKINVGWSSLANNLHPDLQGEEIIANSFTKAGKGNVEMIPVARFSPDFSLPFGYYTSTSAGPKLHQVGVLAKTVLHPEHQALFPILDSGTGNFDPGGNAFGFFATGAGHTAYTNDAWNILLHPAHAGHAVRTYPVKDQHGKLIENTFLLGFEEAKNGDYNDYVFLVKNIKPVQPKEEYKELFNGKNLEGWDIFLRGKKLNDDSEKNFKVQDNGILYVRGNELGYVRTKESFNNYHFKVDFKWGEKKWPPRENAKRDAGICYNIPMNEPDSIWPQSIECQVQEGDCGDFWLLGFSTITVNDSTNKPANHTRMVKKQDGEKPAGEWNTIEVVSYNGKCIHIVNGIVVNAGEKASTASGRLLLQSEFAEVYYRNAKIRKL